MKTSWAPFSVALGVCMLVLVFGGTAVAQTGEAPHLYLSRLLHDDFAAHDTNGDGRLDSEEISVACEALRRDVLEEYEGFLDSAQFNAMRNMLARTLAGMNASEILAFVNRHGEGLPPVLIVEDIELELAPGTGGAIASLFAASSMYTTQAVRYLYDNRLGSYITAPPDMRFQIEALPSTFGCAALSGPQRVTIGAVAQTGTGSLASAQLWATVIDNDCLCGPAAPPTITLNGAARIEVECGGSYVDPGASAVDACDNVIDVVINDSAVNLAVIGIYTVTYTAIDGQGNQASVTREIQVIGNSRPYLLLFGAEEVVLECNMDSFVDDGALFVGLGCVVGDTVYATGNPVDVTTPGVYTLSYTAENADAVTRTVRVVDSGLPVIALVGELEIELECGEAYESPGAVVTSICSGEPLDLPVAIDISGLNIQRPGTYQVVYSATNAGYTATVTRSVVVEDDGPPEINVSPAVVPNLECGDPLPFTYTGVDGCEGDLSEWVAYRIYDVADPEATPIDGLDNAGLPPGEYRATFNLTDSSGLEATEVVRNFSVVDSAPPVITLTPPPSTLVDGFGRYNVDCAAISYQDGFPQFTPWHDLSLDPGFTAVDSCDGVVTDDVERLFFEVQEGILVVDDDGVPVEGIAGLGRGEYLVVFSASDEMGNENPELDENGVPVLFYDGEGRLDVFNASGRLRQRLAGYTRHVNVRDDAPPMIALLGSAVVQLECAMTPVEEETEKEETEEGEEEQEPFQYIDAGAVAYSACGSIISDRMTVEGVDTVHVDGVREFAITYRVIDNNGESATATRIVKVMDTAMPELVLLGDEEITLNYGDAYESPGAMALDGCEGDISEDIQIDTNRLNVYRLGAYPVTYSVVDSSGNRAEAERTVRVVDPEPPVITLNGPDPLIVECGTEYVEPGATARDEVEDLNLDVLFTTVTSAMMRVPGTYYVTYTTENTRGTEASRRRRVNVVDTAAPVITLRGGNEITWDCGRDYVDPGVLSAMDACQGDLAARVRRVITVNTSSPGDYTNRYTVTDNAGNVAEVTRKVTVLDNCSPTEGEEEIVEGEGEGEGEGEVDPPVVDGCKGCNRENGEEDSRGLKRRLGDLLLIGLSLTVLLTFSAGRRRL